MKKTNKFFCVLLIVMIFIVTMLTSDFEVSAKTSDLTNIETITAGETKMVSVKEEETAYFKFVPDESADYIFFSETYEDVYGYLLDENFEELSTDDDSGAAYNFRIEYQLEAGETYYFAVKHLHGVSCDFLITLNFNCTDWHDWIHNPDQQPTCYSNGFIQFHRCSECGIFDYDMIPERHEDENEDLVCDICKADIEQLSWGTCGEEAEYMLYNDGTVFISGSGEITSGIENCFNSSEYYITKIVIEKGITSIGDYAFSDFRELEHIFLPNSIVTIGKQAFEVCLKLSSITIPDSVTSIGTDAFRTCSGMVDFEVNENNKYYSTDGNGSLFNKDKTILICYCENGNPRTKYTVPDSVATIEIRAFADSGLIDIELPYGLTTINSRTFYQCSKLARVTIPDSVTTIGESAFESCESLTSITIPNGVTTIGEGAFSGCDSLTSITLPESLTSISHYCFAYCSDITSITIPDSVTSIGTDAFRECTKLTDIKFSDNITVLGMYAFYRCTSLTSITLPESLTSISHYCFAYCSDITSITIPDSVTSIGIYAFFGWTKLEEVIIPDSVTSLEQRTFSGCTSLKKIEVNENNDTYSSDKNGILYNKDKTTLIRYPQGIENNSFAIPSTVTSIGADAFSDCENLESVTIPNSVTTINRGAFSGCINLKNITIPNSVTSIGTSAFGIDESLTDVYFYGTEEEWNKINIEPQNTYLLNATIHFLGEAECTHTNKTAHAQQDATCTADGYTAGEYCPDCESWISGHELIEAGHKSVTYTQNASCNVNGYKLTSCSVCGETLDYEIIPANQHSFSEWKETKPATCIESGEKSRTCSACGKTETEAVLALEHNWSAWNITEATLLNAGEKSRSCSRCKKVEKITLPKLKGNVTEDKLSGIKIEYTDSSYDGKEMYVSVQEDFSGSQYLGQSYGNFVSWNIKTFVNGIETQPDAPVLVTIPIPTDFDRNSIIVYHINSITGTLEKIEPVVIDGDYIEFLAASFSVYMVIDESSVIEKDPSEDCSCNCHKSGIMGFIWKIINFFNKLFKTNKTCACGAEHY